MPNNFSRKISFAKHIRRDSEWQIAGEIPELHYSAYMVTNYLPKRFDLKLADGTYRATSAFGVEESKMKEQDLVRPHIYV